MPFELYFTSKAVDDWYLLKKEENPSLIVRTERLLDQLRNDPFAPDPPFKTLTGDLNGLYAKRINVHHCLIYQVITDRAAVKVISMLTRYRE